MPGTEEYITTLKQFKELAAEKPVRQKRVYLTHAYGNISVSVRAEPKTLDTIIADIVRVYGEDVTPEDVGLPHFAAVHRISTKQLKPETVVFLPTRP